jgi:hypothetical protein
MVHFPGSANSAHRMPQLSRCHSVILNYNTIAHASFFSEKIFHANLFSFDCQSLVEEKVGNRQVASQSPSQLRALTRLTWITPSGNGREVWPNAPAA